MIKRVADIYNPQTNWMVSTPFISTKGENSYGILAESVGGGGGSAGYAVSVSATPAFSTSVSLGGTGGGDGGAQNVAVGNSGEITTYDDNSHGILAQSVGGGGGAAVVMAGK